SLIRGRSCHGPLPRVRATRGRRPRPLPLLRGGALRGGGGRGREERSGGPGGTKALRACARHPRAPANGRRIARARGARGGGSELLRPAARTEAEETAASLRAAGFAVFLVAEAEARRLPT